MKVLMINGSPHVKGTTSAALAELAESLKQEGIETEIVQVGNKDIRGCIACYSCLKNGKCVFDDLVNEVASKFEACDGLVVASPVYYASANGTLISFLDRLFYSCRADKRMKVGAAVATARRAGTTFTFDEMNKYFTISQMPVVSGRYWNDIFGGSAQDAQKDAEGMQNMRILGRNMAFLMRAIAAEKEKNGLPEMEEITFTSFADGK
ncbi:MAG: flavodoxin family protein [Lachnospiraceae bacterium]|nr:flavodoxin family protein [Lachnospiraceae bacterium]